MPANWLSAVLGLSFAFTLSRGYDSHFHFAGGETKASWALVSSMPQHQNKTEKASANLPANWEEWHSDASSCLRIIQRSLQIYGKCNKPPRGLKDFFSFLSFEYFWDNTPRILKKRAKGIIASISEISPSRNGENETRPVFKQATFSSMRSAYF